MKSVKEISEEASGQCKSVYHKKLTDSYKSWLESSAIDICYDMVLTIIILVKIH
jgi:hypothetical protein